MTKTVSNRLCFITALVAALVFSKLVFADGLSIDKVYHPYVQLLEKEVEYRTLCQQDSNDHVDGNQRHILGIGGALSDNFFAEVYAVGSDADGSSLDLEAYEVELKWQLTEQGEFNNDWGLLFELEKETDFSEWEISTTLIALHEWSDLILTGNLSLIYEWGSDIANEWESAFTGQARYRHNEKFEPALEIYIAEDSKGLGPVLAGLYRLGNGRKLNWEFGMIFGISSETADANWKLNLEYEFQ